MRSLAVAGAVLTATALAGCGSTPSTSSATSNASNAPAPAASPSAQVTSIHLPQAIAREGVVDLGGGKVLVAGGMIAGNGSTDQAFRLDLNSGSITPLPNLGVKVHDLAGGLWNGQPTAIGGGNASEQDVLQAFDGTAWHVVAHMPGTRSDDSAVTINKTTYVLGGYDGKGQPLDVLALQSGAVKSVGQLAQGVRYSPAAAVEGQAYLFGGEANGAMLDVVQRFDPASGKTDVVAHLPHPVGHAMAVVVGKRVLVIGGRTSQSSQTAEMLWFDPATKKFTSAGQLPTVLSDSVAVPSSDGKTVWLIGGENPKVTNQVLAVKLS